MKWERKPSDVQLYIRSYLKQDNARLDLIAEEYRKHDSALPSICPEAGKYIGLMIRLMNAKNVMEFGTCLGYSTVWLAESLKATNGILTAIEYDKDFYAETEKNIEEAGVKENVKLILGDAMSEAKKMKEGSFDIILQDSEKSLYPKMLENCIKLVRVGGLLITDDTLFTPMGVPKELSKPLDEYNELAFNDPRLYTTIIPFGDGMTVSMKLSD